MTVYQWRHFQQDFVVLNIKYKVSREEIEMRIIFFSAIGKILAEQVQNICLKFPNFPPNKKK